MKRNAIFAWEIFLLILTLSSLSFLTIEITSPNYIYRDLFLKIDLSISLIFLADFICKTYLASNKKKYWKENWIQLTASLPAISAPIQAFQILRFLQFARFIKIVHAHIRIVREGNKHYEGEAFYTFKVILVTATIMFASSLLFFDAEFGINPSVHTFFDAIWWAFVTITTTGYGDIHPITTTGRLTAMFLMFFGIGAFAVVVTNLNQKLFKKEEKYIKSIIKDN